MIKFAYSTENLNKIAINLERVAASIIPSIKNEVREYLNGIISKYVDLTKKWPGTSGAARRYKRTLVNGKFVYEPEYVYSKKYPIDYGLPKFPPDHINRRITGRLGDSLITVVTVSKNRVSGYVGSGADYFRYHNMEFGTPKMRPRNSFAWLTGLTPFESINIKEGIESLVISAVTGKIYFKPGRPTNEYYKEVFNPTVFRLKKERWKLLRNKRKG